MHADDVDAGTRAVAVLLGGDRRRRPATVLEVKREGLAEDRRLAFVRVRLEDDGAIADFREGRWRSRREALTWRETVGGDPYVRADLGALAPAEIAGILDRVDAVNVERANRGEPQIVRERLERLIVGVPVQRWIIEAIDRAYMFGAWTSPRPVRFRVWRLEIGAWPEAGSPDPDQPADPDPRGNYSPDLDLPMSEFFGRNF